MKIIDVTAVALEKALEISEADLAVAEKRIAALEAEVLALREFVAAADEWTKWCVCCMDEYESQFRPVMQRYDQERQRLAAERGLPLPGAGEAS